MEEIGTPRLYEKALFSSYIITLVIIIIELTLTYIDKEEFDKYYILHFLLGISLIISTTITFCLNNVIKYILIIINSIFWVFNLIIPFYSLKSSKSKDFYSIIIFLVIIRILSLFGFNYLAARYTFFKKRDSNLI